MTFLCKMFLPKAKLFLKIKTRCPQVHCHQTNSNFHDITDLAGPPVDNKLHYIYCPP